MHLIFGNPAGWWALLGLPALVLIHLLQRQSRRIEVSTLFLLERQEVESRAGRRLERWRNSRLFWWQALAVLLLAWMLSQPRWIEAGTMQRVALVLDSSLAMEAFRPALQQGLEKDTATLERGASSTQWLLLESDVTRPPIYQGEDRQELLKAVNGWQANLGPHDPASVLRAARAAVGNEGLVFFVTYHKPAEGELPVEARALAYGRVLNNVGVAAASAEVRDGQPVWRVLVRNYATIPQKRAWWIESGNQRSPAQIVELEPGATAALEGSFPANADRMVFSTEPDDFTLDDRIPLVLPKPKSLTVAVNAPEDFANFLKPLRQVLGDTLPAKAGEKADFTFDLGETAATTPLGVARIVFIPPPASETSTVVHTHPAPEKDPLMDELNWSGLLYHPAAPFALHADDTTLMWDGATPLIVLRAPGGQGRTLIFNFDPRESNVARLPAFILLINRFAEQTRLHKPAFERSNFPAGQVLPLAFPPDARDVVLEIKPPSAAEGAASTPHLVTMTLAAAAHSRAPSPPAFFTLKSGDKVWLDGASQFPDPRESDFHDAASIPLEARAQAAREEAHSHPDTLTPLWLLLLLGALLASWRETGKILK